MHIDGMRELRKDLTKAVEAAEKADAPVTFTIYGQDRKPKAKFELKLVEKMED